MASASSLIIYLLALVSPVVLKSTLPPENHIFFPDEKGIPYLVNLQESEPSDSVFYLLRDRLENIEFTLYTQNNLPLGQVLKADPDFLNETDWNPQRPTRIVTHGWRSTSLSKSCTMIRDAYVQVGDYNVIVVDWSHISLSFDYPWVARGVMDVGKHVGEFISFLQEKAGLGSNMVKIIGHSLGAHVAGIAARHSIGQIAEVIGLDPAGPFFGLKGPGERIDMSDAKHVQIIHTNAGRLGHSRNLGTSDFFPNGGKRQPGCGFDPFSVCSHSRSYFLYAESVLNPFGFPATMVLRKPKFAVAKNVYMGGPTLDINANGSYALETNEKPPYAKG